MSDKACVLVSIAICEYRNNFKYWDRKVWANSADPDQTAPHGAVWSASFEDNTAL